MVRLNSRVASFALFALCIVTIFVLASAFSLNPSINAQTYSATTYTTSTSTAQSTSIVAANTTTTSTTGITTLSTSSSLQVVLTTSVSTVASTVFSTPGGSGYGIPGFPWEAILAGLIIGAVTLAFLRRRQLNKQ